MKRLVIMMEFRLLAISLFVATVILAACQSGPPQVSIDGAKAELSSSIVGEAMVTMNIKNQVELMLSRE